MLRTKKVEALVASVRMKMLGAHLMYKMVNMATEMMGRKMIKLIVKIIITINAITIVKESIKVATPNINIYYTVCV